MQLLEILLVQSLRCMLPQEQAKLVSFDGLILPASPVRAIFYYFDAAAEENWTLDRLIFLEYVVI